jgi:hypothetical protein
MPYILKEELQNAIKIVNDASGTHLVHRRTEDGVLRRMSSLEIERHEPRDYIPILDVAELREREIADLLQPDGTYYSKPRRLWFNSPKRIAAEMYNDDVGDYHWRDIKAAQAAKAAQDAIEKNG